MTYADPAVVAGVTAGGRAAAVADRAGTMSTTRPTSSSVATETFDLTATMTLPTVARNLSEPKGGGKAPGHLRAR